MAGRPRSTDVDRRLKSAALTLFAEGGLAAVNFDHVARQSGVSRTAIYRRWDSREAMVASALRAFRAASEAGLEDWADRPLDAILDLFVERAAAALEDGFARNLVRQLVALGPEGGEITQTYLAEMFTPRREAFSAKIREAQAHGQIDPTVDPELMQDLLAGALIHRLLLWGEVATDTDPKAYIEAVLEAVGFPRLRDREPRSKHSGRADRPTDGPRHAYRRSTWGTSGEIR